MHHSIKIGSVKELENIAPGFTNLWRAIKASCGTSQRKPRYVRITDTPEPMYPNDYDCARRFAVDLQTMEITAERHVSTGENALMNADGQDRAVAGIPANHAVISCTWNDHYRTFSMTVEVAAGTLPAQLKA